MSRGFGKTQRFLLSALGGEWISVESLASLRAVQHIADEWERDEARLKTPTRAEVETVRRALKRLASQGHVQLSTKLLDVACRYRTPREHRVFADDRYTGCGSRHFLLARRPEHTTAPEASD